MKIAKITFKDKLSSCNQKYIIFQELIAEKENMSLTEDFEMRSFAIPIASHSFENAGGSYNLLGNFQKIGSTQSSWIVLVHFVVAHAL